MLNVEFAIQAASRSPFYRRDVGNWQPGHIRARISYIEPGNLVQ
jgi:hypothetical protein